MLKLLKYEWKACARACLPVYGAAILLAVINRIFLMLDPLLDGRFVYSILQLLGNLVYSGVVIAIFVVTTVILIQRFYKSLLGDEGYLMFTLPVTVGQHIWSKTIIAFIMSAIGCVAALISMLVLASGADVMSGFGKFVSDLFHMYVKEPQHILFTIEALLFCIIASMGCILFIYLCIAMGHMAKKHRVAMAVVWYFVLSTVLQFAFIMLIYTIGKSPLQPILGMIENMSVYPRIHISALILCIGAAIPTMAFFFATRYILQNRLNLE